MTIISRRSFIAKSVGLAGLLFISPATALAENENVVILVESAGIQPDFEAFTKALLKNIARSLEVPYELLAQDYSKCSYRKI